MSCNKEFDCAEIETQSTGSNWASLLVVGMLGRNNALRLAGAKQASALQVVLFQFKGTWPVRVVPFLACTNISLMTCEAELHYSVTQMASSTLSLIGSPAQGQVSGDSARRATGRAAAC